MGSGFKVPRPATSRVPSSAPLKSISMVQSTSREMTPSTRGPVRGRSWAALESLHLDHDVACDRWRQWRIRRAAFMPPTRRTQGNGGGNNQADLIGSFVVGSVTSNGHMNFHFDEVFGPTAPRQSLGSRPLAGIPDTRRARSCTPRSFPSDLVASSCTSPTWIPSLSWDKKRTC